MYVFYKGQTFTVCNEIQYCAKGAGKKCEMSAAIYQNLCKRKLRRSLHDINRGCAILSEAAFYHFLKQSAGKVLEGCLKCFIRCFCLLSRWQWCWVPGSGGVQHHWLKFSRVLQVAAHSLLNRKCKTCIHHSITASTDFQSRSCGRAQPLLPVWLPDGHLPTETLSLVLHLCSSLFLNAVIDTF